MQPLEKNLRNQLERVVKQAREVAEEAAKAALNQIGVGEASPLAHLTVEDRDLRRRLRAHGRQLGDSRSAKGMQVIDRLVEEVAYEYWHRMLFARFLAENNLLMYPDPEHPVSVSLEECEDLASEEGASNGWELAARFAAHMLPQIFRPDSPVFGLHLPPEHEQSLQRLVVELPEEVFLATDSLGWVYQFWQSKKKEEVNNAEVKIGARELPAVTQLFTEPYMVSFLLDNTLGAWWADKRLSASDLKNATSEEELRQMSALPGVPVEYLRFIQNDDGVWTPAGGNFEGWPDKLSELRILDPCCGSGHFLVAIFLMLVPMRMELEGLTAEEAVESVIKDNLHGLDIDQRVTQIAAFTLALNAWRYPGAGGYRILPDMNVACSGLAINLRKEDWLSLANSDSKLSVALEGLYNQFSQSDILGSLINPKRNLLENTLMEVQWESIEPLLDKALSNVDDIDKAEMGVIAKGISKAAAILGQNYHWIVTNVPYLGIRKQNEFLKDYCAKFYNNAKGDIATVFLKKCLKSNLVKSGIYSVVTPSALLNKSYYSKLRKDILRKYEFLFITLLGPRAFETISGEVVDVILLIMKNEYCGVDHCISYVDVFDEINAAQKAQGIRSTKVLLLNQADQVNNPQSRIQVSSYGRNKLLSDYCTCPQGIKTGDDEKWIKRFWELSELGKWEYLQTASKDSSEFGGLEKIIDWSTEGIGLIRPRIGSIALGNLGVGISQTGQIRVVLYMGSRFDSNIAPVIPNEREYLSSIWTFCNSEDFAITLKENSRGLFKTNTAFIQVPFNYKYWQSVADEKYPTGLPKPYSDGPTQWIFHGHPTKSEEPLQVAVARLLGYRWPAELDSEMELSDEARELVRRSETLTEYADEDGILCIPAVRGEAPADERLLNLLVKAYDDKWTPDTLSDLLAQADHAGKSLETWLQDKFFLQHCKLFHHRPFIWHIWDGLRDGFAALVNYHKLDRKNLEILTYTYLGDWIARQKQDRNNGVDGAEEKLTAAENLKKRLELILEGEKPYDIFVRWKPISEQPMGWEPDLNDGVRLNIRPFMKAEVLRYNKKPQLNITWGKDRGKDVESAPWYHLFNGERINDHHLSLEEKPAVRKLR